MLSFVVVAGVGAYNLRRLHNVDYEKRQDTPTFAKEDGLGKRPRHEDDRKPECKEMASSIQTPTIKNNNPNWHSLSHGMDCKICTTHDRTKSLASLVNHYASVHPNNEVFPSRVAPYVAELLRNSKEVHKCEKERSQRRKNRYTYRQFCYFCNTILSIEKYNWIEHVAHHTGYFPYGCTGCSQKFLKGRSHNCAGNLVRVQQRQFEKVNVIAFLCDLCNYVRFDRTEIENHLKGEHGGDVEDNFKEVIFLSFPGIGNDLKTAGRSNGEFFLAVFKSKF